MCLKLAWRGRTRQTQGRTTTSPLSRRGCNARKAAKARRLKRTSCASAFRRLNYQDIQYSRRRCSVNIVDPDVSMGIHWIGWQ